MKPLRILATIPLLLAIGLGTVRAAPLSVNLINNGDAEVGTTGWTNFAGIPLFETAAYAPPLFLFPDAPHGSQHFAGSADGFSAGWQSVDVTDNAGAIDLGHMIFKLGAYLGGVSNEEDNTLLYVSFLDASGSEIDHTELGPVFIDLRANLTVLGGFRTEGVVPAGTRAIQFSLSMDGPDGNSSGAYADNMSFLLNVVHEPQALALLALGLVALAGTRCRAA